MLIKKLGGIDQFFEYVVKKFSEIDEAVLTETMIPSDDMSAYLENRYHYYNQTLFNHQLPDVPIIVKPRKGFSGSASGKVTVKDGVRTLVPNSMSIKICNLYVRDETELDGILIHEMIHIFMFVKGLFKETHGSNFMAVLNKLQSTVDFKIPLTDHHKDPVKNTEIKIKPLMVILYTKENGSHMVTLFSPRFENHLSNIVEHIRSYITKKLGGLVSAQIYHIESIEWTHLSYIYKVATQDRSKMSFYRVADPDSIKELQTDGKLLWDSQSS
jgi:hypothetical protein